MMEDSNQQATSTSGQKRKIDQATSSGGEETQLDLNGPQTEVPDASPSVDSPSGGTKRAKVEIAQVTPDKLRRQIEYYFSDSNYRRDKWLQEEAAKHPEGYIEIAKVAAFPRLKAMTTDIALITDTMKSSDRLQVSPDGQLVKRARPLPTADDSLERTIFAKGFPDDITIDTVEAHFSQFGSVARVVIFRNKDTKKPKGEATVEFEAVDSAKAATAVIKQDYHGHEIEVAPQRAPGSKPKRDTSEGSKQQKRKLSKEEQEKLEAENEKKERQEIAKKRETLQGTVLQVKFACDEAEPKELPDKWSIQSLFEEVGRVRFIDKQDDKTWYVRMDTAEEANKAGALFPGDSPKEIKGHKLVNVALLTGEEEDKYINRILEGQKKSKRTYQGKRGRKGRR